MREIPDHQHTHSLYTLCLSCKVFGINLPSKFIDVSPCGNCNSLETVKYYPSCCILADRDLNIAVNKIAEDIQKLSTQIKEQQEAMGQQKIFI